MAATPAAGGRRAEARTGGRESSASWPTADRIALGLCWAAGLLLCAIAAAIVLYMLVEGLQYVRPGILTARPSEGSFTQSTALGLLDPIVGTVVVALLGTALALPLGVATAVWLSEYARPFSLARAVESGVEVVAGTPSIVLAIFGLLIFTQDFMGPFSLNGDNAKPIGRSFFAAGTMMTLIALPLIVGSTREALQAIPGHVREASYALGKTKAATIRRVLIPTARPGIATGAVLGMGRIVGDTAVIVILLGATARLEPGTEGPLDSVFGSLSRTLAGTGSTLTSFVYNNSPAGEGNAPGKAYAAAFVLLVIVVLLNFGVDLVTRKRKEPAWT